MNEVHRYQVVILRGADLDHAEVLLENHGVPTLSIQRYKRPASELICGVEERFGFQTVAMATPHPTPSVDPLQPDEPQPFLYVLECPDSSHMPMGTTWIPIADAASQEPPVHRALRELQSPKGPFARLGWIHELIAWVRGLGIPLRGRYRQIHGDHLFAVVRFETSTGPAVWFKAVGEPCMTEWHATPALAAANPDCFPRILATRPEWRGWLMEEAPGELLWKHEDSESWRRTVVALAQLQLRYIDRTAGLLALGCKDQRLSNLRQNIEPFFEAMVEVMMWQESDKVARLDAAALAQIKEEAHRLFDVAQGLRIPESLTHGDFGPHNALVSDEKMTFIDWAEASVGDPFSTMEYFLVWRNKLHPDRADWNEPLREAYAEAWRDVVAPEAAREHARIAPALTALTVCLRSEIQSMLENQNRARYMRSMVRTLQRELAVLEFKEVAA
jgi:thiamine kinase-like enzyme